MPTLNDPIRIGDLDLPNRVLMAPLTRSRATEDRVPTDLMLEYYVQRASAGLIISEAPASARSLSVMSGRPGSGRMSKSQVGAGSRMLCIMLVGVSSCSSGM